MRHSERFFFFFFNDTATTEIYTLSLHDALPIFSTGMGLLNGYVLTKWRFRSANVLFGLIRSEEHTSELQSQSNLVCRLLLEKKKKDPQYSRLPYQNTSESTHEIRKTRPESMKPS